MFRWLKVIVLIMLYINSYAQKDTAKTTNPEVDLYKAAVKLLDSSRYDDAIVS